METENTNQTFCSNCNNEILANTNFCRNCGFAQNHLEVRFQSNKKQILQQIVLFFGIEIVVCVFSLLIEEHTIAISLFLDFVMAITAVLFFTYNWKENKFLLTWPSFSIKKLLGLLLITIVASYLVQFLVGHLNHLVFNNDYTFYYTYAFHEYGKYIMVLSVALFPAIFEELAYRGFLMQKLLNIVDEKEAIYITSILFFFIHFSMISFFWMLPFAILLAYVRIKSNTIWYGVFIHFFFNLTACLVEIYNFGGFDFN